MDLTYHHFTGEQIKPENAFWLRNYEDIYFQKIRNATEKFCLGLNLFFLCDSS